MGEHRAQSRAYITTGPTTDQLPDELAAVLEIILDGFQTAKPPPRRPRPLGEDGTPLPAITHPSITRPACRPPATLNRHNPGKILRIFSFEDAARFHGPNLLVEVNQKKMTRPKYWAGVRAKLAAHPRPVYLRVDHARRINGELRRDTPFYHYVLAQGRLLYQAGSNIWACAPTLATAPEPAPVPQQIAGIAARQRAFFRQGNYRRAGFLLRDSLEVAYHRLLTTLQGHSYPEHDLAFLRERAEALAPDLRQVWFHGAEVYEPEFNRLRHAHGGTHRARQYKMTEAEIKTLTICQKRLLKMVERLCLKKG